MRTKSTVKNAVAGVIFYIATVIMGIFLRKAVVSFLGIEYQGIDGLFGNVITMLSIAELGIGNAIIYNLYKPLSIRDESTVSALMAFYRKCYLIIACVVLVLGFCAVPVLPYLVKDYRLSYPIFSIYIWFLLDAVCSYLLAYRRSLLMADQRNYVVLWSDTIYTIVVKMIQVLILWRTRNFQLCLSVMALGRLFENIGIYKYSEFLYPYLKEKSASGLPGELLGDIKKKVKGAACHKIGGFIVFGTDNILISKYLGLAASGIYSNYYLIIRALQSFCTKIVTAATASIGNLLASEDRERNISVFGELQLVNFILVNCAATGVYCVESSVIRAVFGVEFLVSELALLVLSANLYVQGMRDCYNAFKEAAGILYEDRWVPFCESTVNIAASILFMRRYGLAGIFMGTIASSVILFIYTYPILVYRQVLKRSYVEYAINMFWRMVVFMISLGAGKALCRLATIKSEWLEIGVHSVIAALVSLAVSILFYGIWKKEFTELKKRVISVCKVRRKQKGD